jgi:rod shape-determining protein MreD
MRGGGAIVSLYFAVPFLTLIAVVEATVLPHLRVGNAQPDLTLLVVGAWSLRRGIEEGGIWAFVGGIALDLLSAGPFSAFMFALLAASLVLGVDPSTGMGRRQTRPFGGNPVALILVVVLATLTFHLVLLTMLQLARHPFDWVYAGTDVIVPRVLFNLVLMPFVYRSLGWLDRRTRSEELAMG